VLSTRKLIEALTAIHQIYYELQSQKPLVYGLSIVLVHLQRRLVHGVSSQFMEAQCPQAASPARLHIDLTGLQVSQSSPGRTLKILVTVLWTAGPCIKS
jgi:hypothetical protein